MRKHWIWWAIAIAVVTIQAANAASVDEEVLSRIGRLRSMKAGAEKDSTDRYNREMDEAWGYFKRNSKEAVPVLARELEKEVAKPRGERSDMVLLDVGYFLSGQEHGAYRRLSKDALLALDPGAELVRSNYQELFELAYRLADERDPAMLEFFDRAFLDGEGSVVVPQHAMTLRGTLLCVFLYGKHGGDAEAHLRRFLGDPKRKSRVLETLIWIGSPASVGDVKAAVMASGDYDTLVRATSFFMTDGGPEGRDAMLSLDSSRLEAKARKYYQEVIPEVKRVSAETLHKAFENLPGKAKLSDEEVKLRLTAMKGRAGKDDDLNPMAVLDSTLPAGYLVDELTEVRRVTLYRLSNEALGDVKIADALMNAIRYRAPR